MDTLVFELVANAVHMGVPLLLITSLFTNLDGVLVLIVVTEESVDAKLVLKAHWESLILMWEVNKNILLCRLGQLHEVLFELFRLSFFDSLRDDDHSFLELLLLNIDRFVLELDHTQSLESWISRTRKLDSRKDFGRESLCANIFVISVECKQGLVSFEASHLSQGTGERFRLDFWIIAV